MRNILPRMSLPFRGILILFALLLLVFTATVSSSSIFSYNNTAKENPVSTNESVTANSIDPKGENVADSDTSSTDTDEKLNLYTQLPGIGAFFGNMLDSLINLTKNSESRFQSLAHHLPLVFPDLYKVFITL